MTRRLTGPARRISVASRKGGQGKSTLLGALAVNLTLIGYRVLVCEVDDSPYLYRTMVRGAGRHQDELDDRFTMYQILSNRYQPLPGWTPSQAICKIDLADALQRVPIHSKSFIADTVELYGWQRAGTLDLIPGAIRLRDIESEFAILSRDPQFDSTFQLAQALEPWLYQYDFLLFDTPPSLATIQRNVLAFADAVFMPIAAKATSRDDHDTTLAVIDQVGAICERRSLPAPQLLGVVVNQYQATLPSGKPSIQQEIFHRFTEVHYDPELQGQAEPEIESPLLATIRQDNDQYLDAAIAAYFPVNIYAPKSMISVDLMNFSYRVLAGLGIHEPMPRVLAHAS